jgi:hypothetical protein
MCYERESDGEMEGSCGMNGNVSMQNFGGENIKGRTTWNTQACIGG